MKKTTKAHFEHYKACIQKYMDRYKITGWMVYYSHYDLGDGYARYEADYRNGVVTFFLGMSWPNGMPLTKQGIDKCAKHEVAHLFLDPLYSLSLERFVSRDELDTIDERLVIQLEELLETILD